MTQPTVLVVSAFEAKLQPILAASTAGALRRAGAAVSAWDADVCPNDLPTGSFDLVLISIPSYEGIDPGAELAAQFKHAGAERVLVFGQYAWLNARRLATIADGVIMDEPEGLTAGLLDYASGRRQATDVPGVLTAGGTPPGGHKRMRRDWQPPARDLFPPIDHYPEHDTRFGLLGNVEATRGCHHKCTYCAVYAAYDVWAVPIDQSVIMADARQLAAQGARHFAFVDAEFFNTRRHALRAMEQVAAELGPCTFELTTRFDHILEFEREIAQMTELGLRVVTSALEFPSNRVLEVFDKGIDVAGIERAIATAKRLGVQLRPTLITFTPWVGLEDLRWLDEFLDQAGIADAVDYTARQTRLLLYKGSPLLGSPWLEGVELIDRGFYYDWKHPDPRVDQLWATRRQEALEAGATRCCVRC